MFNRKPGAAQGLLLIAIAWLVPISSTIFVPVLPEIIRHFQAQPNAALLAPLALTTPALFVALLAPVAGMLTNRFGRKQVLVASTLLYSVAGLLPFWLDNLYAIIAARALVGIAEASVMTASTVLICDYFSGEQRANWLALQFGSAALVAIVCFFVAGILGEYGWRIPFLIYGAIALFLPIIGYVIFEPKRERSARQQRELSVDCGKLFSGRFVGNLALTLVSGTLFYVAQVHISMVLDTRGIGAPQILGIVASVGAVGVVFGAAVLRFRGCCPSVTGTSSDRLLADAGLCLRGDRLLVDL